MPAIGPTIVQSMQDHNQRMDTMAHNLANVSTSGFKRLMTVHDGKSIRTVHDMGAGMMQETTRMLDVAVDGPGFFVAQAPDGRSLLTRCGTFKADAEGYLVTHEGYRVQGDSGPIRLDESRRISVEADGTLRQDNELVGKLLVQAPERGATLKAVGSTYIEVVSGSLVAATGKVEGGHLEHSNVNPMTEMTDFMTSSRLFELGQKALMVDGEVRRKLTEEIGRTRS